MRSGLAYVALVLACGCSDRSVRGDAATSSEVVPAPDTLAIDAPPSDGDAAMPDALADAAMPDAIDGAPGPTDIYNVVFISSTTAFSSLGGHAPYDAACNSLATAAGLNNATGDRFIAWLSTSTSTAASRIGAARGFVAVDGAPIADDVASLLAAGKIFHPVRLDEHGNAVSNVRVMTGTLATGSVGANCSDYSSTVGTTVAGISAAGPKSWTDHVNGMSCSNAQTRHLLCVGKTRIAALAPASSAGKLIFTTNSAYVVGSTTPDALCQAERPSSVATARAFIAYDGVAASAVLDTSATYVRPDGTVVGTGAQLAGLQDLTSGPWQAADGSYVSSYAFAGSQDPNAPGTLAETCQDWTSTTAGTVRLASPFRAEAPFWWTITLSTCDLPNARLLCVEQ